LLLYLEMEGVSWWPFVELRRLTTFPSLLHLCSPYFRHSNLLRPPPSSNTPQPSQASQLVALFSSPIPPPKKNNAPYPLLPILSPPHHPCHAPAKIHFQHHYPLSQRSLPARCNITHRTLIPLPDGHTAASAWACDVGFNYWGGGVEGAVAGRVVLWGGRYVKVVRMGVRGLKGMVGGLVQRYVIPLSFVFCSA
jgi:hypothetical protein